MSYQGTFESSLGVGGSRNYKLQYIYKEKGKKYGVKYGNMICYQLTYSQAILKLLVAFERNQFL